MTRKDKALGCTFITCKTGFHEKNGCMIVMRVGTVRCSSYYWIVNSSMLPLLQKSIELAPVYEIRKALLSSPFFFFGFSVVESSSSFSSATLHSLD